jgi:hypothetical protein
MLRGGGGGEAHVVRIALAAVACVLAAAAVYTIAHTTTFQPALHDTQKAVVGVGEQRPDVLFWKLHKVGNASHAGPFGLDV